MVRCVLLVAVLLLSMACAFPNPKGTKISVVRNTDVGLGLAGFGSKTSGVQDGVHSGNGPRPVRADNKDDDDGTEIALADNVNVGGAAAVGDSVGLGTVKQSTYVGVSPFGLSFL